MTGEQITRRNTTSLATALPDKPLATVEELRTTYEALASQCNLVSPITSTDSVLPMHGVSLRAVMINPNPDAKEVYRGRFCKGGDVAPAKPALAKLMAAAGVNVVDTTRVDDRSVPHFVEMRAILAMRDLDGTWRTVQATKVVDLTDGASETKKADGTVMSTGALNEKRIHAQANAETKAINRALRLLLNLKQTYTQAELARPFVVPKLVPQLDTSDPEVKRMLVAHALGGEAALYGTQPVVGASAPVAALEAHVEPAGQPEAQIPAEAGVNPAGGPPDPWDTAGKVSDLDAKFIGLLPIGTADLAGVQDPERHAYLARINELAGDVLDANGGDMAVLDGACKEIGIADVVEAHLETLAKLGKLLASMVAA